MTWTARWEDPLNRPRRPGSPGRSYRRRRAAAAWTAGSERTATSECSSRLIFRVLVGRDLDAQAPAKRLEMAGFSPTARSYAWRMWIPRTAEELERAASEELLKEKTRFEVKRELPAPRKNADLAVDVSALTVD
jgi:hypothetical protein